LPHSWGAMALKRFYWIFVFCLLVGVFGGSAVTPVDQPETAFNESDAPVNLALPSRAPLRFFRPVSDSIVIPLDVVSIRVLPSVIPKPYHTHPLQELLSTFLI
jgi:hypothetical protein